MNNKLNRPIMNQNKTQVYVLKHANNPCMFLSTRVEEHELPCVVGFTKRDSAQTLRKLMNHKVRVESFDLKHIARLCHDGYLNFVLFSENGAYEVMDHKTQNVSFSSDELDVDHFRFLLENAYRYF